MSSFDGDRGVGRKFSRRGGGGRWKKIVEKGGGVNVGGDNHR